MNRVSADFVYLAHSRLLSKRSLRRSEQLHILSECVHLFVKMWLVNTQLFTPEERERARPQAHSMYERFLQHIQTNLTAGKGFLGDYQRRLRTSPPQATEAPRAQPPGAETAAA